MKVRASLQEQGMCSICVFHLVNLRWRSFFASWSERRSTTRRARHLPPPPGSPGRLRYHTWRRQLAWQCSPISPSFLWFHRPQRSENEFSDWALSKFQARKNYSNNSLAVLVEPLNSGLNTVVDGLLLFVVELGAKFALRSVTDLVLEGVDVLFEFVLKSDYETELFHKVY